LFYQKFSNIYRKEIIYKNRKTHYCTTEKSTALPSVTDHLWPL